MFLKVLLLIAVLAPSVSRAASTNIASHLTTPVASSVDAKSDAKADAKSDVKSDAKAEEARVQAAVAKEKKILNQYSLEELNAAGTYLMAVFEASLDEKTAQKAGASNAKAGKILECDPTPEKAQLWLSGPLHALIDAKTEAEGKAMSKSIERDLKKSDKKWKACADQCQCASYMAVIEQVENSARAEDEDASGGTASSSAKGKKSKSKKLSVSDQNRLKNANEWLEKENKKATPAASAQCASRQAWFCKSPLQTYLSEAAEE